jgi:L,D-transpeptidase catalytic domain
MPSCFTDKRGQPSPRRWRLIIAILAGLTTAGDLGSAADGRTQQVLASVEARTVGEPIMTIVSVRSQKITVYDADGWILRAPVSSGQVGRETPAGIFSIIQKEAEHHSNLYDDAYMPHMQRLTWSGIALHGGHLPGHAASHGCVRMPYDFAERLFDITKLGMRVIVAPNDVEPLSIAHPALFQPKPDAGVIAAARAAEADEAARKVDQARLAAQAASRDLAQAMAPVRVTRNLKLRVEAQLGAAERASASASSAEAKEQSDDAKAKAAAKVTELEAQLAIAEAGLQPKLDAVAAARTATAEAEAARLTAAEAARSAARALEPVSVFISRKTQRLYVRQAFQPILDIPVTIRDADLAIGTHVFTALKSNSSGDMQWSVVSLISRHSEGGPLTDSPSAKKALDRIAIPQDTLDQIAGMVSPRSSLIVSDEGPSVETRRGTEFVILMSGEPQGGIKHRRRAPEIIGYSRSSQWSGYLRSQFGNPSSTW